ncbi:MAG TPA: hypothetical protein VN611_11360 [Patescibacteria group bacterium]|nr:hypothetical protein [Patescibacteria group bacterium]
MMRTIRCQRWCYRGLMACLVLLLMAGVSGCGRFDGKVFQGQLNYLPENSLRDWGVPEHLQQSGEGNICRVVQSVGLNAAAGLELAAGSQGEMEYFVDGDAAMTLAAGMRVQFLSTQGAGRIKISAHDGKGGQLAAVGWNFTGALPAQTLTEHWISRPFGANFSGCWLEEKQELNALLRGLMTSVQGERVAYYRLSVIVGQGQHAVVTQLQLVPDRSAAIRVRAVQTEYAANQGTIVPVELELENISNEILQDVPVELVEPAGFGLNVPNARQILPRLEPGKIELITWQVRAQRPQAVNLDRPWEMGVAVDGVTIAPALMRFSVSDPEPGHIFYVMTEDLEAIDSAGYAIAWGNGNGWLDPEEMKVQMVDKPERLNAIAEKYGAKWTHYTTWPLVKAAEWADRQSKKGRWGEVVRSLREAVRNGAAHGHEYGIHLHADYDPRLAGNLLSYNPAVDGLWANHLRHGWAHTLSREGDLDDVSSRTGILGYYQAVMEQLSADSPQGQLLSARVGSFDFGDGEREESLSTRAYQKVGLWGSSDADGNAGGVTAAEYGRELYFARKDDINASARDFFEQGLVELRPTPRECIAYDTQSATVMNSKVDEGVAAFSEAGRVTPGVHLIMGFTHAMFVMGAGDWKTLEGGQFQALDDHLAYLKNHYVAAERLQFATATQVIREYLDYYSPWPVAVYDKKISDGLGVSEYGISILGKNIPITVDRPQTVTVKYPLYFRHRAFRVAICKNGRPIYVTWGLPTLEQDIRFVVDDRQAHYTMKIYHNSGIFQLLKWGRDLRKQFAND